jgi:hypothetical protein
MTVALRAGPKTLTHILSTSYDCCADQPQIEEEAMVITTSSLH